MFGCFVRTQKCDDDYMLEVFYNLFENVTFASEIPEKRATTNRDGPSLTRYTHIAVLRARLYRRRLFVIRSADGYHDETYGKINCVVRSDGMVHWIPPAKYRVFCDVDLTNWPFGEHTCSLRLGSWTYDGNSVSMQINNNINVRIYLFVVTCALFGITNASQR